MKAIIVLEELIKGEEKRLALLKRQLSDHESGANKLTTLAKASTESSLEENQTGLEEHRAKLAELLQQNLQELEKEENLKAAIERKNYYHYQKVRLKRDKVSTNDEKLEAMMIIDELPDDVHFEDKILLEIASKTIELNLRIHEDIAETLATIKNDFEVLTKDIKDENINNIGVLKFQIPMLVLHFSVLISNIKENIEEEGLGEFKGFPKFEDWWIEELWSSHQAYFGLYKWKSIVKNLCITSDQRKSWDIIFSNWISVKKMIAGKKVLGFELNYAFDTLIRNHTGLEEELSKTILITMESIIKDITTKEDFTSNIKEHNIVTPYMEFKIKKLGYIDVKSGKIV
jgi:hypothetical protein